VKLFRLILAIVVAINLSTLSSAYALDLYVDTKTKQIFAEPGPGRVHMGSYVKAETPKILAAPSQFPSESLKKTETAELTPVRRDQATEMGDKAANERLVSQVSVLEERVQEVEKIHGSFDDRGLHWATKDGNFSMSINGRLQPAAQYNFVNEVAPAIGSNTPNELNSGMNIRRARLGAEGTFYKIWDYKFEFDFSRGNGSVASGITDAFIRLNHTDALSYRIGSF